MLKRTRLWHSMTVCTIAGAGLIAGCQSEDSSDNSDTSAESARQTQAAESASVSQSQAPAIASEGEAEGQAEGEGVGAESMAQLLSMDDLAFLGQLDLINGHLLVGMRLLAQGQVAAARTHMKHPGDELYSQLENAFANRDLPGFANELESLSNAVDNASDTDQAYQDLQEAISTHAAAINNAGSSTMLLQRATRLLRTAADEYAIGVVGGEVSNVHEYQDAWGFTDYARQLLQSADDDAARERAVGLLNDLRPLWPGLMPPPQISGDASQIYGAAARMELLAASLSG